MRDKFRESGTTRRPCTFEGKANAHREEKGKCTGGGPGVRSTACRESERRFACAKGLRRDKIGPEILRLPPRSDGGKRRPSWMKPVRQALRAEGKSEWPRSEDGQDSITCLERKALLRPRLSAGKDA